MTDFQSRDQVWYNAVNRNWTAANLFPKFVNVVEMAAPLLKNSRVLSGNQYWRAKIRASTPVIQTSLFQHWSEVNSLSCVRLFVTLCTVALQAPLSTGSSRQKYWNGLPCSSWPRIEPPVSWVFCIAGRLYHWAIGEGQVSLRFIAKLSGEYREFLQTGPYILTKLKKSFCIQDFTCLRNM